MIGANSQFAGICPHHLSLGGFGYQTASERRAFRQFLATFDSMLPFNQLAMLGEQHTAQALFVATRGSLRPLVRLLREAAFCAIDRATPAIGSEDLALGFESIEAMVGGAQNPFTGMLG